jgi:hypothetical protein
VEKGAFCRVVHVITLQLLARLFRSNKWLALYARACLGWILSHNIL